MQVVPMKPTLKAPETTRLKLECDEPLPNFAFNFNLRRYSEGSSSLNFYLLMMQAGAYTRPLFGST